MVHVAAPFQSSISLNPWVCGWIIAPNIRMKSKYSAISGLFSLDVCVKPTWDFSIFQLRFWIKYQHTWHIHHCLRQWSLPPKYSWLLYQKRNRNKSNRSCSFSPSFSSYFLSNSLKLQFHKKKSHMRYSFRCSNLFQPIWLLSWLL